jgi:hypothetical protein
MTKSSYFISALLSLVLGSFMGLVTFSAMAQEAVVLEDMSRAELRAEIEKYENEFYRVFNANVSDKKFEIHCARYTPTNSNISVRACEPTFVVDARNENANSFQLGIGIQLSPADLRKTLDKEFEALTEMLNALLAENDYFKALNADLTMLRQMLAEKEAR